MPIPRPPQGRSSRANHRPQPLTVRYDARRLTPKGLLNAAATDREVQAFEIPVKLQGASTNGNLTEFWNPATPYADRLRAAQTVLNTVGPLIGRLEAVGFQRASIACKSWVRQLIAWDANRHPLRKATFVSKLLDEIAASGLTLQEFFDKYRGGGNPPPEIYLG